MLAPAFQLLAVDAEAFSEPSHAAVRLHGLLYRHYLIEILENYILLCLHIASKAPHVRQHARCRFVSTRCYRSNFQPALLNR
jgi:hypothetical protein